MPSDVSRGTLDLLILVAYGAVLFAVCPRARAVPTRRALRVALTAALRADG